MAIILFLVTLPIPLAVAYSKTREEIIHATSKKAKELAEDGYHYKIAVTVWVCIWGFLAIVI
jgi:hypothetical protein